MAGPRRHGRHFKSKPNWLRRLGRDRPGSFELVMRAREKAALTARKALPGPERRAAAPAPPPAAVDLPEALRALGVACGDTLMVHSAWERVSPLEATPAALVATLRETVGSAGTLCMPAYPRRRAGREIVLDVRRTPSNAGLVTEVFRRTPGVLRSRQLRTVAALGPLAAELTGEHHHSPYPSGKLSPYAKLAVVGGKVLCLGVGPEYNTMFHCAEDVLGSEFPVAVYEDPAVEVRVVDVDGSAAIVPSYERSTRWTYCCDAPRMLPYFEDATRWASIGGVDAYLISADVFLERLLDLARRDVHMYGFRFPRPR